MCRDCYLHYGSPTIDNHKVRATAELIQQIHETNGGGAGGDLHTLLDEWNIDGDLRWERENLLQRIAGDPEYEELQVLEIQCLALMEVMTIEERASALGLYWKHWAHSGLPVGWTD
jgi:hypothetical protein